LVASAIALATAALGGTIGTDASGAERVTRVRHLDEVPITKEDGSQVCSGLASGGNGIRTLGPPSRGTPLDGSRLHLGETCINRILPHRPSRSKNPAENDRGSCVPALPRNAFPGHGLPAHALPTAGSHNLRPVCHKKRRRGRSSFRICHRHGRGRMRQPGARHSPPRMLPMPGAAPLLGGRDDDGHAGRPEPLAVKTPKNAA
jgi:hypothetical protein